jgi:hypothetical protein
MYVVYVKSIVVTVTVNAFLHSQRDNCIHFAHETVHENVEYLSDEDKRCHNSLKTQLLVI